MTRIGINPARGKVTDYRPERVTVAMVTYIPNLAGYFEGRLEVLRLALASLMAHTTSVPHDLMIFDNGSCPEVVGYLRQLQEQGLVDYLILSERNIGKIDALRILFNAAPGEVIAYSDDDIFFYPGWLEAQLEILDGFPQAGMVSGAPVRNAAGHAHRSLDRAGRARRSRAVRYSASGASPMNGKPTGRSAPGATRRPTSRPPRSSWTWFFAWKSRAAEFAKRSARPTIFSSSPPEQVILQALPSEWTRQADGLDDRAGRSGGRPGLPAPVHRPALHPPPGQRPQPRGAWPKQRSHGSGRWMASAAPSSRSGAGAGTGCCASPAAGGCFPGFTSACSTSSIDEHALTICVTGRFLSAGIPKPAPACCGRSSIRTRS